MTNCRCLCCCIQEHGTSKSHRSNAAEALLGNYRCRRAGCQAVGSVAPIEPRIDLHGRQTFLFVQCSSGVWCATVDSDIHCRDSRLNRSWRLESSTWKASSISGSTANVRPVRTADVRNISTCVHKEVAFSLHKARPQAAGCHQQAFGLMTMRSLHTRRTSPRQATVKERRATEMLVVPAAFMSRVSCMS